MAKYLHNPRCAIFHEPPGLRDPSDCNCGAIPPLGSVKMNLMPQHSPQKIDAVARCLAKLDGKHVGAADWADAAGSMYRERAGAVLETIDRFDSGIRSGGLPGNRNAI